MEYTTEMITAIAEQVVGMMKETLETEGAQPGIAGIETQMRAILRQVGVAALGQYLSGLSEAKAPKIACPCGGELVYQGEREASLLSVFGRVYYRRSYYAGCPCGQGQVPLDQQLELKPGRVSAGLGELLALSGVELAFEQARRWVEKYLLFSVSENTIRSATEARGAQRQCQKQAWIQTSQDAAWLQARQRGLGRVPKRLYGSLDAAKARIEPRCPEEKAQRSEAFRDLKVGCWELEAVPPAQQSRRQREKYDREQQVFRARNLVSQYYPQAVQIVGWYHATEYLEKIASLPAKMPCGTGMCKPSFALASNSSTAVLRWAEKSPIFATTSSAWTMPASAPPVCLWQWHHRECL